MITLVVILAYLLCGIIVTAVGHSVKTPVELLIMFPMFWPCALIIAMCYIIMIQAIKLSNAVSVLFKKERR